jgi:hypothetical protein
MMPQSSSSAAVALETLPPPGFRYNFIKHITRLLGKQALSALLMNTTLFFFFRKLSIRVPIADESLT